MAVEANEPGSKRLVSRAERVAKWVVAIMAALAALGTIGLRIADTELVTHAEAKSMHDVMMREVSDREDDRHGAVLRELDLMHSDVREIRNMLEKRR